MTQDNMHTYFISLQYNITDSTWGFANTTATVNGNVTLDVIRYWENILKEKFKYNNVVILTYQKMEN